jgi:hypothetical protein
VPPLQQFRANGGREADIYRGTPGIRRSSRRIPVDIPKNKLVSSSFDLLDPKKQLSEAGYPYNRISMELTALHGKFQVVSSDVAVLKDQSNRKVLGREYCNVLQFGQFIRIGGCVICAFDIKNTEPRFRTFA